MPTTEPPAAESGSTCPADVEDAPDPSFPLVVGLLLPWLLFLAAFTPRAWWGLSVAFLVALGFLLVLSARWAYVRAAQNGDNPTRWAALTVVTLGTALLLLGPKSARRVDPFALESVCDGCGRLVGVLEPFCYGCGAHN